MKQLKFQGRVALSKEERGAVTLLSLLFRRLAGTWRGSRMPGSVSCRAETMHGFATEYTLLRRKILAAVGDRPDVVTMLADAGAPARMIDDVEAFGDLIARCDQPLVLDRCAADDSRGGFHIAYFLRGGGVGVRRGDEFYGGIMLHGNTGNGRLRVAPRIVRQVCTNGMVNVTDQAGRSCAYWRDPDGRVRGEMELAFEAGLTRAPVRQVVERLATLAEIPALEPIEALAAKGVRVPRAAHARVRRVFERDGDRSLYGALNALTETARDAATVSECVRLEELAGRSALLKRPTPTKTIQAPQCGLAF